MSRQHRSDRAARRAERRQTRLQGPILRWPFGQPRHPRPAYDWLAEAQIEQLHLASMQILEEVGLDFFDDEALDIWQRAGAKVDRSSRHVWLDRGLVQEAVARAPTRFTWQARNPAHRLTIGDNFIAFAPQAGMAYVQHLGLKRQPGTLEHLQNFMKLAQLSPVLHFAGGGLLAAQDVAPSVRHLYRMQSTIELTDKPMRDAAHGRIIPADTLELARLAFGGTLPAEPVLGGVINVNSPLRYDERMLGGLISYARAGQATVITPFILAGAMSPVTLAAALAQQNAEALAGIALTQLIKPGVPVVYGGFTTNVDMISGGPAFGTPEGAWALLVGAQLARRYRLPYRGSGSLTTAKTPDAQAAYESMWTLWPAVLAHTNYIHHAVGWLDGGLTASYEKFIIDLEGLAMFHHFLAGFSVDESALALDMIAEVGPGGHHFGTSHTQARYADAFYPSALSDRLNYETWQAAGEWDAVQRAHDLWPKLLAQYQPPPLDPAIREAVADFVARRERELAGVDLYGYTEISLKPEVFHSQDQGKNEAINEK